MCISDSHCHLGYTQNDDISEVDAVINRAHDASVRYMLNIGTKLSDVDYLRNISDCYENVFRTVGIHPLNAKQHYTDYSFDEISQIIKNNCLLAKTVGIGEIGLDYHYENESSEQQKELFHLQLDLACELDKPVSIHSRDAHDDTISILQSHKGVEGVMHCFSGDENFAKRVLDLGMYISISGVVTYKKSTELQDIVKYIPMDRLLIETDAPFLAPVPYRGKENEPAYIVHTAAKIADILGVEVQKIAQHTTENFLKLFRIKRS